MVTRDSYNTVRLPGGNTVALTSTPNATEKRKFFLAKSSAAAQARHGRCRPFVVVSALSPPFWPLLAPHLVERLKSPAVAGGRHLSRMEKIPFDFNHLQQVMNGPQKSSDEDRSGGAQLGSSSPGRKKREQREEKGSACEDLHTLDHGEAA